VSDDPLVERSPDDGPDHPGGPTPTFRQLFAVAEFRTLYTAAALSFVGDYLAKAAITVLVFQQTRSVALSAASFALTYLPWVAGGPVLAALAERYPYRRVMVVCDLVRMVLIGTVAAVPGLPVPVLLALIFVAMLANPPTQAARSALMPQVLPRELLVTGLAVNTSTSQAAQVVGYLAGAAVSAALDPRVALAADAATFAVSAAVLRWGLRARGPALSDRHRSHLLRETGEGFRLVFGTPRLRSIAVLVFSLTLFAIVPEGLAAAWAQESGDGTAQGLAQGMIMAAGPAGFILGGLIMGRFVPAERQTRLIRPLAVLAPAALIPALTAPPAPVVALMALVSGFAVAGLMPVLNGIFVLCLPHGFRARAYGVMQGGLQLTQGGAVLATGLLAQRFGVPLVVGAWSVAGLVLMTTIVVRWRDVSMAQVEAEAANGAPGVAVPTPPEAAPPLGAAGPPVRSAETRG
jgi:MFS family permease